MTRSDFSKPVADVAPESEAKIAEDAETLSRQRRLSTALADAPRRAACVLCGDALQDARLFRHRAVLYVQCAGCGHVQSLVHPPLGYPGDSANGVTFDRIYPPLDPPDYHSRRDRIYAPKLEWALTRLEDAGMSRESMLGARWLDLGAGAGYFLDSLRQAGATEIQGLEENEALAVKANEALGADLVTLYRGSLAAAVRDLDVAVYVAFFVLEHLEDPADFWAALATRKPGTVFLFSVPVFGFATLLESAFKDYAARNLDNVIHTQLYTDRSIRHAVDEAGYELLAEWVFGQDAIDLRRLLLKNLREVYPAPMLDEVGADLARLQDPLQAALDRARLADARHLLAVKR